MEELPFFLVAKNASVLNSLHGFPLSRTLALKVSMRISEAQALHEVYPPTNDLPLDAPMK